MSDSFLEATSEPLLDERSFLLLGVDVIAGCTPSGRRVVDAHCLEPLLRAAADPHIAPSVSLEEPQRFSEWLRGRTDAMA